MPVDPMRDAPPIPAGPAPKLPLPGAPAEPLPEEPALPEEPLPEAPLEPAAPKKESPERLAEMANQLFDAATKLQRDAEALMKAIRDDEGSSAPEESMSPEEGAAASKALIGL